MKPVREFKFNDTMLIIYNHRERIVSQYAHRHDVEKAVRWF